MDKKNVGFLLIMMLILTDMVFAGSGMPWDSALNKVTDAITGPVAGTIALVAVVGAGAALIFMGQEMGQFMKALVYVVIVGGIIVGASSIIGFLGGNTGGALI
ncbi:MAG: TrbC/VirB2 family protein [Campylobacterales bacterium]|nr:TrbC/VirB2 family protein [Campylobacterales bacterium]